MVIHRHVLSLLSENRPRIKTPPRLPTGGHAKIPLCVQAPGVENHASAASGACRQSRASAGSPSYCPQKMFMYYLVYPHADT